MDNDWKYWMTGAVIVLIILSCIGAGVVLRDKDAEGSRDDSADDQDSIHTDAEAIADKVNTLKGSIRIGTGSGVPLGRWEQVAFSSPYAYTQNTIWISGNVMELRTYKVSSDIPLSETTLQNKPIDESQLSAVKHYDLTVTDITISYIEDKVTHTWYLMAGTA